MVLLKIAVLYLLVLLEQTSCGIAPRIVNGDAASNQQFPFVAALTVQTATGRFLCGGALISEEWILTSAVCTSTVVNITVILGSTNIGKHDSERVVLTTSEVYPHPDFALTLQNDIGLVKLPQPVEFSDTIQPIRLATINLPKILRPIVVGWGQTTDDSTTSDQLKYATLNILTNDECKITYGSQIVDTMVCLKGANNEGICYGDSGSPLVVRPIGAPALQHVGVGSFFGINGCENSNPSGFTRTFAYLAWIKEVTGLQNI